MVRCMVAVFDDGMRNWCKKIGVIVKSKEKKSRWWKEANCEEERNGKGICAWGRVTEITEASTNALNAYGKEMEAF